MAVRSQAAANLRDSAVPNEGLSIALGRYRLENRLGHGGAASVYRGVEVATGKPVAIKRLIANPSARLAALFELEYHTLASLKHPNIVEVYDFGNDASGPYYVMELLEGDDLSKRGRLPWREAAQYGSQVAEALALLHARRFVHRDVSARNVWRTPNGQLKLIDFGALSPFGQAGELVGTPPHVAPEALEARMLDQRTDLYGLGTLLYWLLTGSHAYPARNLRDLPGLWSEPISSVSERLARLGPLGEEDPADLPAELDALVMALLSQNPMARPSTSGEVVDRLSALTARVRSQPRGPAEALLGQPTLVGRERERKHFMRQLEQLRHGHGQAALIVGGRRQGRTRLLAELATDARIHGVHVIELAAKSCAGPHGVAEALLERLLDTLPDLVREPLEQHKAALAGISHRMRERLGAQHLSLATTAASEGRARIHEALSELVVSVATRVPLVIFIDDFERADESSIAWLTSLSERLLMLRIVLVLGLDEAALAKDALALRSLRQHGKRSALRTLGSDEAQLLLASLFGDVPNLGRLSERLWRVSHGVPGSMVELAHQLVREGVICNAEGTWTLPQEVPEELLIVDRDEQIQASLRRLGSPAGGLAARLAVHDGLLPLALCRKLSALPPAEMFLALEELMRERILTRTAADDYRFDDDAMRRVLLAQLKPDELRTSHRTLGEYLLANGPLGSADELTALVHLMEGGDLDAPVRIARVAQHLGNGATTTDEVALATPALERALALFRAAGKPEHEQVSLLGVLTTNGYFADRKLLVRYGAQGLAALQNLLGLSLAARLRPWLGKLLSLFVGLAFGALRMRIRKSPYNGSFVENMALLFNCWGCHAGVATICVDPETALAIARATEPLTALGKNHVATFAYQFNLALATTIQERISEAHARWQALIARLEDPNQLQALAGNVRQRYLAGCLYTMGVLECWRDDPNALRIAERLDGFSLGLYQMSADQIRATYYANQGNQELHQRYRKRVEMHAIQRGSAWQVETWSPGATITPAVRAHDAMALKESHEQLLRLKKHTPSLGLLAERCQGAFLHVRRRYDEALPLLERCLAEKPLMVIGWARAHGLLAACLNALGQHARAKQICEDVLARLAPGDDHFPAMNLNVHIELAHADAGLGDTPGAMQRLLQLLSRHRPGQGALTLGALHEAAARIALRAGDQVASEEQAAEMQRHYFATGLPSLVARYESFVRETRRRFPRDDEAQQGAAFDRTTGRFEIGPTLLERALSQGDASGAAKAERVLRALTNELGEVEGALFSFRQGEAHQTASIGESVLAPELAAWLADRLRNVGNDDVTETDFVDLDNPIDPDVFTLGAQRYRMFALSAMDNEALLCVGAAVFLEPESGRRVIGNAMLQAVSQWMLREYLPASTLRSVQPSTPNV
jgi:tetratricopeptide (TPR) repeat protein